MILRRFMQHVKEQNWFAVGLDVIVVIVGIFLGMQVQQWYEQREENIRSKAVVARIVDDLELDSRLLQHRKSFWSDVLNYSLEAEQWFLDSSENKPYTWSELLVLLHATQAAQLYRTELTFDELKSSGELHLIRDSVLRNDLARYYSFFERTNRETTAYLYLPEYREKLRSYTPGDVLTYYWNNCYQYTEESDQSLAKCSKPENIREINRVLKVIEADPEILQQLRKWISVLKISTVVIETDDQITLDLIERAKATISEN